MSFNKNTWEKDYTGAPGLKKLGKIEYAAKKAAAARGVASKEVSKDE